MKNLPMFIIAGMPSVLPSDMQTVFRLNEGTIARVQSISFFLVCLIAATLAVWQLWNFIAKDSNLLPRISFARSCCMVVLWGSLFVIVLTMISGARELLTPGAWKKNGFTYTLEERDGSSVEIKKSAGNDGNRESTALCRQSALALVADTSPRRTSKLDSVASSDFHSAISRSKSFNASK